MHVNGTFIGLEDGSLKELIWLLREYMSGKHFQGYLSYKGMEYYYEPFDHYFSVYLYMDVCFSH